MALRHAVDIIAISGIFRKSDEELGILPPPPPFPEIGEMEKRNKAKDRERGKKERHKKTFGFFQKLGLAKTEQEKKRIEKQRQEYKRFKEIAGKRREEEKKKKALEKEKQKEEKIKAVKKSDAAELKFPKIGEFEKELTKPEEVIKAEGEIQKAIEEMKKVKKKKPVISLFRKKKLFGKSPIEEKIEIPDIMPRVEEKADGAELIEKNIRKARLALMEFKFENARNIYIGIMKLYNGLDPKKKEKVYQDIKDLYYERKSAEKFMK